MSMKTAANTITQTKVEPYLFFDGRCEEAINFYRNALGAELIQLMRYKESPEPPPPGSAPVEGNKIMHASFRIGETTVMASDGEGKGRPTFQGFSLSLTAADDAEAKRFFTALGSGGRVELPLSKTFFASQFGMVVDRFGVMWMIIVSL